MAVLLVHQEAEWAFRQLKDIQTCIIPKEVEAMAETLSLLCFCAGKNTSLKAAVGRDQILEKKES